MGSQLPEEDGPRLRLERPSEHVAVVVINAPAVANALSGRFFAELDFALDTIEQDDAIRVWLLTGAPRPDGRPWFSSGADLREAAGGHGSAAGPHGPAAVIDRVDDLLKPSIAVIAGVCTTGALELAMACDLRIAAESARLSDWHLKRTGLGIGAWGAAARLSRLVGVDKAKELLLLGEEVSGTEAERIGLVNKAVPDDDLMPEALQWAATIADRPRRGVRATLGFLQLSADMSKQEALRWAQLTPGYMGLELRPFRDAAQRFYRSREKLCASTTSLWAPSPSAACASAASAMVRCGYPVHGTPPECATGPRPSRSTAAPTSGASTSSTPPTSTDTASRRRSSPRRCTRTPTTW
jgi:enoyl-CoA hydratase/carnithine racemase